MKAIIEVDVPEFQIGQEAKVYFKDTMMTRGVCKVKSVEHLDDFMFEVMQPYCENVSRHFVTKKDLEVALSQYFDKRHGTDLQTMMNAFDKCKIAYGIDGCNLLIDRFEIDGEYYDIVMSFFPEDESFQEFRITELNGGINDGYESCRCTN